MCLTKRYFIETVYSDGYVSDYSFNPEGGYPSIEIAEKYLLKNCQEVKFQVTERIIEFPVKRTVAVKSITTITEIEVDGILYRKTEADDSITWEQLEKGWESICGDADEWVTPYILEIEKLNRLTNKLEKKAL